MSAQYYYLIASLPELAFDRPEPPLKRPQFLALCAEHVPPQGCRLLAEIDLAQSSARTARSAVVAAWHAWDRNLRKQLARLRAQRLGWQAPAELAAADRDAELCALAERILDSESPRTVENELDRARWRRLEDLQYGHPFDFEFLALYSLKLLMLQRRAMFDRERGRDRFLALASLSREPTRRACTATPEVPP